jgi:hypothetical protein
LRCTWRALDVLPRHARAPTYWFGRAVGALCCVWCLGYNRGLAAYGASFRHSISGPRHVDSGPVGGLGNPWLGLPSAATRVDCSDRCVDVSWADSLACGIPGSSSAVGPLEGVRRRQERVGHSMWAPRSRFAALAFARSIKQCLTDRCSRRAARMSGRQRSDSPLATKRHGIRLMVS